MYLENAYLNPAAMLALTCWAVSTLLVLIGAGAHIFRTLTPNTRRTQGDFALPGVSVLKPLRGKDEGLEDNLESFLRLNYPRFEIIFSVERADDAAAAVATKLIERHFNVDAKLVVGAGHRALNPKVSNLLPAFEQARYALVLISDSNIRAQPDDLKFLVSEMGSSDTGLVFSLVDGQGEGLGAHLEGLILETYMTRWTILSVLFGHACVTGKSMLLNKSAIREIGGWARVGSYVVEDYMLGATMRQNGLKTVLARQSVAQYLGEYSVRESWNRNLRWARLRRWVNPPAFIAEILSGSLLCGAYGAWAIQTSFGVNWKIGLPTHLALWIACDFVFLRKHGFVPTVRLLCLWPAKELLLLVTSVIALSGRTVVWRNRSIRLGQGGLILNQDKK